MQSLVIEKEQYGFSVLGENPRGCSQLKRQNLPLIMFVLNNRNLEMKKHP